MPPSDQHPGSHGSVMGIVPLHPSYVFTKNRGTALMTRVATERPSIIPRQHFQQLDLKDQVGVGLDVRTELAIPIPQVRGDEEFALAADAHAHHADIPALDHPTGADHALEGLAAIIGGVELAAIFKKPIVLGGDQRPLDHFLAITQLNIFDHQFVAHHSPLLVPHRPAAELLNITRQPVPAPPAARIAAPPVAPARWRQSGPAAALRWPHARLPRGRSAPVRPESAAPACCAHHWGWLYD